MPAGKVSVVGIGPGLPDHMTAKAREALEKSDVVIGYKLYVEQVKNLLSQQEIIASSMGKEVERCLLAIDEAGNGKKVALVSGGDPGIYGMSGLLLQLAGEKNPSLEVEIIPGVTAAGAAAALLGAPLMHDFAVISLSDLLTPWELIEKRLEAAAYADYVIVLYNPRSRGRSDLLSRAREIVLKHRQSETPVGIVRGAGRNNQKQWETTLEELTVLIEAVDMASLVIIGNSHTYWDGCKMITPRGYQV